MKNHYRTTSRGKPTGRLNKPRKNKSHAAKMAERWASRAVGEESLGGAAAVDPGVLGGGFVAEAEELVQEGPEEDPAEDDPQRSPDVGKRLRTGPTGGVLTVGYACSGGRGGADVVALNGHVFLRIRSVVR